LRCGQYRIWGLADCLSRHGSIPTPTPTEPVTWGTRPWSRPMWSWSGST